MEESMFLKVNHSINKSVLAFLVNNKLKNQHTFSTGLV